MKIKISHVTSELTMPKDLIWPGRSNDQNMHSKGKWQWRVLRKSVCQRIFDEDRKRDRLEVCFRREKVSFLEAESSGVPKGKGFGNVLNR